MKLSVSAFRAQASAQRKILSSYQNQLNYGACASFPALEGFKVDEKPQMMVDNTGIGPPTSHDTSRQSPQNSEKAREETSATEMLGDSKDTTKEKDITPERDISHCKKEDCADKSPARTRTKSNQRWMKLRTTVQLSGAISSANQKSKPALKREDSFLKRFSTRQIPETQETVDTGDDTETINGSQTQNEVNRRRRKRRKELSKAVVNPDENFYFYWLMTVTVCVLYNLWTLIVRQSFPELQKAASAFWYAGDGFTDLIFICDVVVQFRTGYLEQGLMVYDSKKLATHYLKSRAFLLDLLSLVPLDFLQLNIGVNPILRFPRFLKTYRIYSYYYMVESRTVYPNLWRVVNLIHILLILAHWFGCFYYLLSEAEGFQGDWVYPYRSGDYATLTRKYLGSLYWSTLTLTTIGDLPTPETNAESRGRSKAITSSEGPHTIPRRGHKSRILQFNSNYGYLFTITSYLIGVFIFATIVGQVGNVITNRNANRLEFERLLDGAKTYMRHHKVPGGMKRRVLRWYDYSWSRGRIQGGGDINTALGLLPDKLKTELALHVNLSVLKKVTIFQECQPEFLHDLVLKMKAYIFTPGDLICRKGEVAREMFIIADGILDVISETGRVLTTMKAGDFFGEIGILNLDGLNKRTADVRSVGYSELFSLSREDVLTAMKDYPEAQEILQNLGRKRLMEAKNASKMHKAQTKQFKDRDSSGESDTAGKRIVEKLRSDVKGLKNVLRRSRRGTRIKEGINEYLDASEKKVLGKKRSILRRMSHVQSSDEFEANSDATQSPLGAGLPLLQRLKILKEKQEREKEEKVKMKLNFQLTEALEENFALESSRIGTPLTKRDADAFGSNSVASTVRTQLTGLRFDKCKTKTFTSPKEESVKVTDAGISGGEGEEPLSLNKTESNEMANALVTEKTGPSKKVKDLFSTVQPNFEMRSVAVAVPEKTMPKSSVNKHQVPKSKDAWKMLKKLSITQSKRNRINNKPVDKNFVRKISKKGLYLSKSNTVLERQETEEEENGKRSISTLSSEEFTKNNLKEKIEIVSLGNRDTELNFGGNSKEVNIQPEDTASIMKKYDSISDLSPEYSGLPFVKKLKILNERQKLAELEKELIVRSSSLDVPDYHPTKSRNILMRSQSEASTIQSRKYEKIVFPEKSDAPPANLAATIIAHENSASPDEESEFGIGPVPGMKVANDSVTSPESNETIERRNLKSILKKLSAEESTSEEEPILASKRIFGHKRNDNAEMKKLLRAPTVEGYAARHRKLLKSVTFDSDALAGPPDMPHDKSVSLDETKTTKGHLVSGLSKASPTAILTLQLSNLSMIPIVSPKTSERLEIKEKTIGEKKDILKSDMEKPATVKIIEKLRREIDELWKLEADEEISFLTYVSQEHREKNLRMSNRECYRKNRDEQLFRKIEQIVLNLLEETQDEFRLRYQSLQVEVKKKDDLILQLQSKLQKLEREDTLETILDVNSPTREAGGCSISFSDNSSLSDKEDDLEKEVFDKNSTNPRESHSPFERSSNMMTDPDLEEVEEYWFCAKNTDAPLANGNDNPLKWHCKNAENPLGSAFDDRTELRDRLRTHLSDDLTRKRQRPESKLKKNLSVDEAQTRTPITIQRRCNSETKFQGGKGKYGNRSKQSLLNRITNFQRSLSYSQENKECIAIDIDDSSTSSDAEQPDNKDWEVQMLVKELEKRKNFKRGLSCEVASWMMKAESNIEQMEDVRRLQKEVDTLKRVVCDNDLSRLTNSELDMLETILEAKDQKIAQIARASSLDPEDENRSCKRPLSVRHLDWNHKLEKYPQRKKPSLRQKIGQALSFDFDDIKGTDKALPTRKQKTSASHQEKQRLFTLWHTSSLLRNRVLEDNATTLRNQTNQPLPSNMRSSLPILISGSLSLGKNSNLRSSLPALSSADSHYECLAATFTFEENYHKRKFNRSSECVFQGSNTILSENRTMSYPSISMGLKINEQLPNSLNNFIKSVGQKVKQVMTGDSDMMKKPVPTISMICEDQFINNEADTVCSEEFTQVTQEPAKEEVKAKENEGCFDSHPKTETSDV